jgi:tetratricopeptide (TPR) repeat protein
MLNGCVTAATRPPPITEAALRAAAGERSFERGVPYLDAVSGLATVGNQVMATVRGTGDYLVVLTLGEAATRRGLRGECGCPYGQEGFFCKHCVAVGLAVMRNARGSARRGLAKGSSNVGRRSGGDLSYWLNSLSREELLAIVCDQVIEDDEWRRRLELRAAAAAADVPAISARVAGLLQAESAFGQYQLAGQYGYLEGPEAWHYARRVRQVAEVIGELARTGHPAGAAVIAEQAFAAIAQSSRHSSDRAGVIVAAAAELAAAHQEACRAAPPDPARLADFLAERVLSGDELDVIDVDDYSDLLGAPGLARLRERVTAAWTANPSAQPEREALERVLWAEGDVEGLVQVMSADLDARGLSHLRIAQVLDSAGRADEALAWAERGLSEPSQPDEQLADYVVERYWSAGRFTDAVTVRRERLSAAPGVAAYEKLRDAAERAGNWQSTKQWALGLLRADVPRRSHPPRPGTHSAGPGSARDAVLIDVLIADGDIDAAWESAEGLASDAQWQRLADLVLETRPADALAVYLRLIEALKRQTGDGVYERIAKLLVAARACHGRLGTGASFDAYLRRLREDQKRKRRLIRILDAHQL